MYNNGISCFTPAQYQEDGGGDSDERVDLQLDEDWAQKHACSE